jgi:hypothetical protein
MAGTPKESEVRPESVLKKSLVHVKQMQKEGRPPEVILDQFKSIRQVAFVSL